MLKSSVKLFQTCLFLIEIWIWTFKSWFMLELAWISVFCLPSLFTKSLIYLSHSNLEVRRKIPKWVVPWITVSVQGTNCRVLTVDFGWSLKKNLGLQLVPRVLTADFGWSLQKKLGLQLVPRVLTADFDQRVVVLLKFSEMQLVLMVSKINMLPPPLGHLVLNEL